MQATRLSKEMRITFVFHSDFRLLIFDSLLYHSSFHL